MHRHSHGYDLRLPNANLKGFLWQGAVAAKVQDDRACTTPDNLGLELNIILVQAYPLSNSVATATSSTWHGTR